MCYAAQARIEADLSHLVSARQKEVDHAISDHAAWEANELVVEATPLPEAVPEAWGTLFHAQQLPVSSSKTRNLPHCSPNLREWEDGSRWG